MRINIDFKEIPKQDYFLNGEKFTGEVAFIDGFNGHTKTDTDGLMCALINKSCWNSEGVINILKDSDGNIYHSENRRRLVYEV
jgi:hypothetical protein